ncbi:hypothetical protein [Pectobacterium fontis]|uniref:hypothetical protein n=1 Tax=Pectobacterium fontis TaxID=2558042 RepID=UPI0006914B15
MNTLTNEVGAEKISSTSKGDTFEVWLGANRYHYRTDGYVRLMKEGQNHAYPARVPSDSIKAALAYIVAAEKRADAAESQLAELRGQEPVEYKIVDPFGEITLRCEKCEADMYSEMDTWSVTPLYAAPVPLVASQPSEMRETLYRIANHIASAKGGMPEEWHDWADELETDIRRVSYAASQTVNSETIECWSCKKALTLQQRLEADGMCPHCDAEIELESDASASQPIKAEIYELVAQAWKLIPQSDDLATAAWHSAASVFLRGYPRNLTCQPSYRDGIEAAANWIDTQREAFDNEHGWHDPDTGTFEFGNDAQLEHSSTLAELSKGIRSLHPSASQPYTVPDERAAYEVFIAKRLGDSIDTRRAKNGDPENPDYMAWDMTVGWISWQGRAAMLQTPSVQPAVVTAEHRRVIGLLLEVCGAAFELADDAIHQAKYVSAIWQRLLAPHQQ